MASWGKVDYKELKELEKRLSKVTQQKLDEFYASCAKEIAARLLAEVVPLTPVGDYTVYEEYTAKRNSKYHKKGEVYKRKAKNQSGKVGGTLRRSWTISEVRHNGRQFVVEVVDPVEYASYVEYGHRQTPGRYVPAIGKRLTKSWVKGRFMLTISEQEIREKTPDLLEKRVRTFLREVFGDGS